MRRATESQKGERLNLARGWLRQGLSPTEASERLVATAGVSHRQAYRYVEQAQRLKAPVPVEDAKIAFTVKLSQSLMEFLHQRLRKLDGEGNLGILHRHRSFEPLRLLHVTVGLAVGDAGSGYQPLACFRRAQSLPQPPPCEVEALALLGFGSPPHLS